MFVKTVIRQNEKIHSLVKELKTEKENSENLRYENVELTLIIKQLQNFKDKITEIMNAKGTIVDKYDKIKEVITSEQTNNNF